MADDMGEPLNLLIRVAQPLIELFPLGLDPFRAVLSVPINR
ncbi:MAG: hypothetical protein WDO24_14030 [Pseudomonadota bacterium]